MGFPLRPILSQSFSGSCFDSRQQKEAQNRKSKTFYPCQRSRYCYIWLHFSQTKHNPVVFLPCLILGILNREMFWQSEIPNATQWAIRYKIAFVSAVSQRFSNSCKTLNGKRSLSMKIVFLVSWTASRAFVKMTKYMLWHYCTSSALSACMHNTSIKREGILCCILHHLPPFLANAQLSMVELDLLIFILF